MADNDSNNLRIAIDPQSTGLLASNNRRQLVADWFIKDRVAKERARARLARGLVVLDDGTVVSGEQYLVEMRKKRDSA